MAIVVRRVARDVFESYPEPKQAAKDDPYKDVIPALQEGYAVEIEVEDEAKVRGARMAIGRRAKEAGIVIAMRYSGRKLAVDKVGETTPQQPARGGGRPKGSKKQEQEQE